MTKDKSPAGALPKASESKIISEQSLQILMKEYDALRDLFTQSENTAQSIFNFYLTLVTTIFGAVVLVAQLTAAEPGGPQKASLIISFLLVFATGIGSVYLSALSGRYAHIARYAQGIDEIRRSLLGYMQAPIPPLYQAFLSTEAARAKAPQRSRRWAWLFTTLGTYQIFVSLVNSLSLSIATWLFLSAAQITTSDFGRSVFSVIAVFVVTFVIYNIYPRVVTYLMIARLNVRIDVQQDFPFLAGKL
jgi:hypothetical protein